MLPTSPHYVSVVDEVDNPIKDATVEIYYDGGLVDTLTTTSNGITDWFYLNSSREYEFVVSRTGYWTERDNLTLPSNQQEVAFRLELKGGGDYESIYEDIMYSLTPGEDIYENNVTVNFSIVSTNSSLEYYGMDVYYMTNLTNGTWTLEASYNDTTAGGGFHNHTLNMTGRWRIEPYFKKENLSEYTIAPSLYIRQNKSGLHDVDWSIIPDDIFFMVLIICAGLIGAFFYPLVGSGSIWLSFGVFAFGFLINPSFQIDMVGFGLSSWNLLIIMGLLFFSLWMVIHRI